MPSHVDDAPPGTIVTKDSTTEAYIMSSPVSLPVSASIPVSGQLGSSSSSALECPSTVSSHFARLPTAMTNF